MLDDIIAIRNRLNIALHPVEILEIMEALNRPLNFLIFGVGNDSKFWSDKNSGGKTVFIEDNYKWFEEVKKEYPDIEAYMVDYNTRRSDWNLFLMKSYDKTLDLELPESVLNTKWDVILVDGPSGWDDVTPGRMKSIYMARQLASPSAEVFIHDTKRKVEQVYCDIFFKDIPYTEITKFEGLRHYKI